MDEPLSNLDAKLRVSTRAQIKNLSHELQVTTVYVTHDQIEAMTLADRVVVMNKGVVQQWAPPPTSTTAPANTFVAASSARPDDRMQGDLRDGTFHGANVTIPAFPEPTPAPSRGLPGGGRGPRRTGEIAAPVYTSNSSATPPWSPSAAGGALVAVKAPKDFRAEIGDAIAARVPASICHLIHPETGERLAP